MVAMVAANTNQSRKNQTIGCDDRLALCEGGEQPLEPEARLVGCRRVGYFD
jgi:hypothetical protein